MPKFPLTIEDRTFTLACTYLESIGYDGPVCISCDDTKLHPGLKTYWDTEKEQHFIVGTTGDPILVENEFDIREQVAQAKKIVASTVSYLASLLYIKTHQVI